MFFSCVKRFNIKKCITHCMEALQPFHMFDLSNINTKKEEGGKKKRMLWDLNVKKHHRCGMFYYMMPRLAPLCYKLIRFHHAIICSFVRVWERPTCPSAVTSIWEFSTPALISESDTGNAAKVRLQVRLRHSGVPSTGFTLFIIAAGNITAKDRERRSDLKKGQ